MNDKKQSLTYYLAANGQFGEGGLLPLHITLTPIDGDEANVEVHAELDEESFMMEADLDLGGPWSSGLKDNLQQHLTISNRFGKTRLVPDQTDPDLDATTPKRLVIDKIISKEELIGALPEHGLHIKFDDVEIGTIHVDENGRMTEDKGNDIRRLTSFELRGLSQPNIDGFLQNRDKLTGYNPDKHRPITDLHTHLTSQISAHDLIEIAKENGATYPVELLIKKLGVKEDDLPKERLNIPSRSFSPTASEGLACEQRGSEVEGIKVSDLSEAVLKKLENAMSIPADRCYTFDMLERRMYRFRNPFGKDDTLIEPIILKVAEDYKRQGVTYSETSVTGVLDPKWLEQAEPALKKAEETYGVALRFLVGIPRSIGADAMENNIRQAKFAAQSPYVVGVDFLGYEVNKTQTFQWALNQLADWAATEGHQDFTLRIHAGETGKNAQNVLDALRIANLHDVPIRIGHGVHVDMSHELREVARQLVKKGLLMVEFNPDSNLALNNIDFASDIPIREWRDMGVPILLATDGGGAYQTNLEQTAFAGLHAGLELSDLGNIRKTEVDYIAKSRASFEEKQTEFERKYPNRQTFFDGYKEFCDSLPKPAKIPTLASSDLRQSLPKDIRNKTPLVIAGASGSSWQEVSSGQKTEFEIGVRMLIELLDPDKIYFGVGRIKDSGLTHILDRCLTEHHAKHRHEPRFSVVGLLSTQGDNTLLPLSITHRWDLAGDLLNVPTEMMNFVNREKGAALYAGGSAFTRDFILLGQQHKIPFGVMNGPVGASTQKARVLDKNNNVFEGAVGMVKHVQKMQEQLGTGHPLFKEGIEINDQALKELYHHIKREVANEHQALDDVAYLKEVAEDMGFTDIEEMKETFAPAATVTDISEAAALKAGTQRENEV